jgi:hypothetical protein
MTANENGQLGACAFLGHADNKSRPLRPCPIRLLAFSVSSHTLPDKLHHIMSISTALNFSCTRGGEWYACNTSSQFVGCCSVNPCTESCPKHALHPITFDPATFGQFPDLSCGIGAFTFTCSTNQTFYGCCKTNPCFKSECPIGDLVPAFAGSSILKSIYGDPSLNFVGATPLTTASPKQAPGPLSRSPQSSAATKIGRLGAIRLIGVSIAILVTVCLGLGLWLIYRNLTVRSNGRTESAER